MVWTNDDGMGVLMHAEQGQVVDSGVTNTKRQMAVFTIEDATTLADADTDQVGPTEAPIPAGAVILNAWIVVDAAFTSGGAAVLDVGTKAAAGTTIDDDGIDAAVALAALGADDVVAADGALIGTKVTADSYITATYDTAAFTAGSGKVVVEYLKA